MLRRKDEETGGEDLGRTEFSTWAEIPSVTVAQMIKTTPQSVLTKNGEGILKQLVCRMR